MRVQEKGKKSTSQFEDFGSEATLHGLNKVASSSNRPWRRVLWLIIVLFMLAVLTAIIASRLQTFLSFPTTTKVTLTPRPNLTLPSITVCNNNRLRKSIIDSDPLAKQVFAASQPAFGKYADLNSFDPEVDQWLKSTDALKYFEIGSVPAKEFITNCTHSIAARIECPQPQQTYLLLGLCYTMTVPDHLRHVQLAGPAGAFTFHINVHEDEYSSEVASMAVGAQIAVHPAGVLPSVAEMFTASPGTELQISIAQKENVILREPYNPGCAGGESYTRETCLWDCFANNIRQNCSCKMCAECDSNDVLPPCSLYSSYVCVPDVWLNTYTGSDGERCGCSPPCEEVTYDIQLSQMTFPAAHAASILRQDLDYLRKNVIVVRMFFRTMNVERTEQHSAYTLGDFGGDTGGYMGLFLGASVISISELLEFLAALCLAKCSAKSSHGQTVHVEPADY